MTSALELDATRELSMNVRLFRFRPHGAPLSWRPGQHLELDVPGSSWRPYSIASVPRSESPGSLELAIGRVEGDATTDALFALKPGDRIGARGPLGEFTWDGIAPERPALLVGVGTGVSPMRALITERLSDPATAPVTLLFGARTEQDLLFRAELEALTGPRFRFEPTLSRPSDAWSGRRGRVHAHIHELLAGQTDPAVFLCGSGEMAGEARALLASAGVASDSIRAEYG